LFHTNTTTMASTAERADEEACRVALLDAGVKEEWQVAEGHHHGQRGGEGEGGNKQQLGARVWEESRKLWDIVAPAIFSRVVTYSMNVITQAFAGHLGDLDLAAFSIANTVVDGFNFAMLVGAYRLQTLLLLPSYICSLVVMCEIEIYPPLTSTTPASNEGIGFSGQSMLFFW